MSADTSLPRGNLKPLQTVYATVDYWPLGTSAKIVKHDELAQTIGAEAFDSNEFICMSELMPEPEERELDICSPTASDADFRRKVTQLHFDFQEIEAAGDRQIREFYFWYGRLGERFIDPRFWGVVSNEADLCVYESLGWAKAALSWFNKLTNIVRWTKDKHLGPLWDMFGEPREERRDDVCIVPSLSPGSRDYSISLAPWPFYEGDRDPYMTPENEEELIEAAWFTAVYAVQRDSSYIRLTPMSDEYSGRPGPVLWAFEAYGALRAAFAQWYFQEMANVDQHLSL